MMRVRGYTRIPYPRIRKATVDLLTAAKRKNMIHSLVEADITRARSLLRQAKRKHNGYYSFTGYIIRCVAEAVVQNKMVHAYRDMRGRLVLFDDVDVSTTVERKVGGRNEVVAKVVRGANGKSVREISEEIETEKSTSVEGAEVFRFIRAYLLIPPFVRRLLFRFFDRSPQSMKRRAGTVLVTSVLTVGSGAGWGIPIASHTVNVTVGGIVKRPVESDGGIDRREHLCLTVSFDHDIVDGAPAARYTKALVDIIESGEILNER